LLAGEDGGAAAALARAHGVLRQLVALDATLEPATAQIEEATIAAREALDSLRRYAEGLDADPARQEWVESRLAALEAVARKHRAEARELPALRQSLAGELAGLEAGALTAAQLQQRLEAARKRYLDAAQVLTRGRRKAATALDHKVTEYMQSLGMPGGVFATRVEPQDPPVFTAQGNDDVEFLVSANPGQPPRPLARVASGGELSRISLALQVAAVQAAHLPCLVFDEVDAGVGGAVAEMVGRQLKSLPRRPTGSCGYRSTWRPARRTPGSRRWTTRRASRNWRACWAARPSRRARATTRWRCWRRPARRAGRLPPLLAVRARLAAHAAAVQGQRMIGDLEA
jgi:DNA repair protein RecN (Recombination protein N)